LPARESNFGGRIRRLSCQAACASIGILMILRIQFSLRLDRRIMAANVLLP
jgi:hypothetical protein